MVTASVIKELSKHSMQSKRQKVGLENYIQKMEQDGDKYFLHNGKFEGYV